MSQLHYQPQPPESDALRPARHAALLMGILGMVCILFGALLFAISNVDLGTLPPDVQQQLSQIEADAKMDLPTMLRDSGMTVAVVGLILLTIAFFVRRGGSIALRLGMVATTLMLLWIVTLVIQSLHVLAGGSPAGIPPLIMSALLAGLFVLQFVWLLQARRNQRIGMQTTPTVHSVPIPPPPEFGDVFPPPPPPSA